MRFFTFIKNQQTNDPYKTAFNEWIAASKMGNSPHAGIPQIQLFLLLNNAPEQVMQGFRAYKDEYEKEKR